MIPHQSLFASLWLCSTDCSVLCSTQLVDKKIFYYFLADDLNNYHSYIIQSDLLYSRLITCS